MRRTTNGQTLKISYQNDFFISKYNGLRGEDLLNKGKTDNEKYAHMGSDANETV